MPTALVTGATGFLGRHATAELAAHGWRVIATGRAAERMPSQAARAIVADLDALPAAAAGARADVVVHCAALSTPWARWRDLERVNVRGTARALAVAERVGARRFVHISSPSIYAARGDRLGIREDDVDERSRLTGYIRSKIAAERLLRRRARSPRTPEIVVLRPRGLVGAGDPSLVPRLLAAHARIGIPLFRGGAPLVDLTAVGSAARAVRLAAEVPEAAGGVFNITNGEPRPFRRLAERLLDALHLPHRFRPLAVGPAYAAGAAAEAVWTVLPLRGEPPLTRYTVGTLAWSQTLDIGAARRVLGYEPTVSVDDALEEYAHA